MGGVGGMGAHLPFCLVKNKDGWKRKRRCGAIPTHAVD